MIKGRRIFHKQSGCLAVTLLHGANLQLGVFRVNVDV